MEIFKVSERENWITNSSPFIVPPEIDNPDSFPYLEKLKSNIEVNENKPTREEIRLAMKSFKNGKCKGTLGLYSENLKYARSEILLDTLTELIGRIWDGEKEPDDWKLTEIATIFKNKGSRSEANPIKNVQTFKYLGYHISNSIVNDHIDVQSWISLAENKLQEMKQLLCDRELQIKLRSTKFLQPLWDQDCAIPFKLGTLKNMNLKE